MHSHYAIQIAAVHTGGEDPSDLVVDYRRGMYAVEQYLFARSYMYAQVYHHKTVRAAEWMYIKTLYLLAQIARQDREPSGLPVARTTQRVTPSNASSANGVYVPAMNTKIIEWSSLRAQTRFAALFHGKRW